MITAAPDGAATGDHGATPASAGAATAASGGSHLHRVMPGPRARGTLAGDGRGRGIASAVTSAQRLRVVGDMRVPGHRETWAGTQILRLSGALSPGQAQALADAVVARLDGQAASVSTVVLELQAAAGVGTGEEAVLRSLDEHLRGEGITLRLVIAAPRLRDALCRAGTAGGQAVPAIHPSLHSAVLAAYAELPGPGVVTPRIRAVLAAPAEPLDRTGRLTPMDGVPHHTRLVS